MSKIARAVQRADIAKISRASDLLLTERAGGHVFVNRFHVTVASSNFIIWVSFFVMVVRAVLCPRSGVSLIEMLIGHAFGAPLPE